MLFYQFGEASNEANVGTRSVARSTGEESIMSKVLMLYYSSWGHIETLARAEAKGARCSYRGQTGKLNARHNKEPI